MPCSAAIIRAPWGSRSANAPVRKKVAGAFARRSVVRTPSSPSVFQSALNVSATTRRSVGRVRFSEPKSLRTASEVPAGAGPEPPELAAAARAGVRAAASARPAVVINRRREKSL